MFCLLSWTAWTGFRSGAFKFPTARFCNYPCVCGTALDELRVQNSKMNTTLCGSLNSRGEDGRSVQGQCYANRLLHLPPKKKARRRIGGVA